jgi:hypothetical protein
MPGQPHGVSVTIFNHAISRGTQHICKGIARPNHGGLFIKVRKIHAALLINKAVGWE